MYEFELSFDKHPDKEHASFESKKEKLEQALYRKFETYIPRNETVQPRFQLLHSCNGERFIYSLDRSYMKYLFTVLCERTFGSIIGAERSGMYQ
jgi:hypothetical protein